MNENEISYSVDTLISEEQIKKRITELGREVNQFYKNTNKLLVVPSRTELTNMRSICLQL